MDPDGDRVALQNKVLFDMLYSFCCRGGENLEKMKRNWFEIKYDPKTDCEYTLKVYDECTKNHKEVNKPIQSNFMPENKTDRQCPV